MFLGDPFQHFFFDADLEAGPHLSFRNPEALQNPAEPWILDPKLPVKARVMKPVRLGLRS